MARGEADDDSCAVIRWTLRFKIVGSAYKSLAGTYCTLSLWPPVASYLNLVGNVWCVASAAAPPVGSLMESRQPDSLSS